MWVIGDAPDDKLLHPGGLSEPARTPVGSISNNKPSSVPPWKSPFAAFVILDIDDSTNRLNLTTKSSLRVVVYR